MPADLWFKEWLTPHESHAHRIRKYLVRKQTPFQKAVIADTYSFGRCLVLDGEMQSAQMDEFIYHETLVHPALIAHPNPKSVLVLGGGEGATVRELLKHKTVRRIVMVDIDGQVVDFCKKHMKSWHQGAFESPKLELVIDDAKAFVENTAEKFDVIVADLPTPDGNGPVVQLYTRDFYKRLAAKLKAGGMIVTQSGSGSLIQLEFHQALFAKMRGVFKNVRAFYAHVPSFDVPWAYLIGSNTADPLKMNRQQVAQRIDKRMSGKCSFYDDVTHVGLFNIPKHMRARLDAERLYK